MLRSMVKNLHRLSSLKDISDNESDKGLVLSLSSLIEKMIEEILLAFVINNKASKEIFKSPGTAGRRALLACSLGLITEHELKLIQMILKIRNYFAHEWDINFSSQSVSVKMDELKKTFFKSDVISMDEFQKKGDRYVFQYISFMLLTDLVHREDEVIKRKLTQTDWPRKTWENKFK